MSSKRLAGEVGPAVHEESFQILQREIVACRKCPRLVEWRERVGREKVRRFRDAEYWARPIPAFGRHDASLLIVGLAPAAHGGNRTGRMFTGDQSGDWLFEALYRFGFANQPRSEHVGDGLQLRDAVIVAALRCAPPANKPLPEELRACRSFLRRELELLSSRRVVIALGHIAFRCFLQAWRKNGHALPDGTFEFRHGGEWTVGDGLTLIASYHPSRQNTQTGRLTRPMFHRVFRRARSLIDLAARPARPPRLQGHDGPLF